jgi:cob(I)alamin adenosyltransferase
LLTKGCVQVYTGNGKGKTTAAFGLALRAAGAGLRVFIVQFMKGQPTSELAAIENLADRVTVRRYGRERFIATAPAPEDIAAARQGLADAVQAVASGHYDMVVLDEANMAVHFRLFSVDALLDLIAAKAAHVELVITGRNAAPRLIERADLVTEMREVKHYYSTGVPARRGIEH